MYFDFWISIQTQKKSEIVQILHLSKTKFNNLYTFQEVKIIAVSYIIHQSTNHNSILIKTRKINQLINLFIFITTLQKENINYIVMSMINI